jgi:hypothetical protein
MNKKKGPGFSSMVVSIIHGAMEMVIMHFPPQPSPSSSS